MKGWDWEVGGNCSNETPGSSSGPLAEMAWKQLFLSINGTDTFWFLLELQQDAAVTEVEK